MTAVTTSPFLTPAFGAACFTDALMRSPTPANFLAEPPRMRMHMISFAPVLSATLRRVCGWIMLAFLVLRVLRVLRVVADVRVQLGHHLLDWLDLHGLAKNLDQPPALVFAEWARLLNAHSVADVGGVMLVMRLELGGVLVGALVERVALERLDGDDNRLLHLVAGNAADLLLAAAPLRGRGRLASGGGSAGDGLVGHASGSSSASASPAGSTASGPTAWTWASLLSSPRWYVRRAMSALIWGNWRLFL